MIPPASVLVPVLSSVSASVPTPVPAADAGSSTPAGLPLVVEVTFAEPLRAAVGLLLFACLAVLAAGGVAVAYRWYFRQRIPEGVAVLLGVSAVVLYLNTASLGSIIGGTDVVLLRVDVVLFNVVAVGVAAAVAPAGAWTGDVVARNVFAVAGGKQLEGEIGRVVRTVGRVTPVTLPAAEDIADMDSYEAVAPATKEGMAGRTLLFPRRVTVAELRERLVARIKEDFGVNYVDVDVTQEGDRVSRGRLASRRDRSDPRARDRRHRRPRGPAVHRYAGRRRSGVDRRRRPEAGRDRGAPCDGRGRRDARAR
ncbi:hypothetical protein ACFQAS_13570 [Halopenitus salinus]|uniref:hypothetical protein n=1 Tax=Halopenitus salinus TaxID=1198295 RepID=UPI003619B3ED